MKDFIFSLFFFTYNYVLLKIYTKLLKFPVAFAKVLQSA